MSAGSRLCLAAEAYGDACIAQDAELKGWKRGDPVPNGAAKREALEALKSAARAYATSNRRKRQ